MFSARRATLVATLLQVAGAPVLPMSAQVDSGVRIRITTSTPSGQRKVGTLVSADADTLRFTSSGSGAVQSIPTASVVRLERSRGRRSNAGRGAVIGGVIGGGLGLILGIAGSAEDNSFYEIGPEEVALVTPSSWAGWEPESARSWGPPPSAIDGKRFRSPVSPSHRIQRADGRWRDRRSHRTRKFAVK